MPLILLTSPPFTFMLIFPSTAEEQPIRLPVILPSRTVRLTFPETFPVVNTSSVYFLDGIICGCVKCHIRVACCAGSFRVADDKAADNRVIARDIRRGCTGDVPVPAASVDIV